MPGKNKKIKIAHLVHTYIPRVSGVAMNTHAILAALSKTGCCECVVFAPHERQLDVEVKDVPYRIERYFKSPVKKFMDDFFIVCQLLFLYRKEKFDVLHCHGVDQIYFGSLFKKFIPSVILIGMFRNDEIFKKNKKSRTRKLKKVLPSIDKIIAINPVITDIIISENSSLAEKIIEIPLGIELKYYESVSAVPADNTRYVLYLGRLNRHKRLDVLLQAFSYIHRDDPLLSLYIVGEGPALENLRYLARSLNIADKVYFLGVKTGEDKIRLIKNAELFVFTSEAKEGLAAVLLEALACRKLIVVNDYITIKTLIKNGQTGMIYENNSSEDLAEKIVFGLRHRHELEAKFRPYMKEMLDRYELDKVAMKYAGLYRSLVSKKHEDITGLGDVEVGAKKEYPS